MGENKELTKEKAGRTAQQSGIVEFECQPEEKELVPQKQDEKTESWGAKSVTRTFLIIALAVTVLINAAITAGITGALLNKQAGDRQGMHGQGRPESGMFPEDEGDGEEMLPPGEEQDGQEQSSKTMIGILIKEDSGVYIAKVTGENAKKAGFREGDKVVSIDGKDVATSNDLISEVQSHKPGDTVAVTVERNGQPVEIKTELE